MIPCMDRCRYEKMEEQFYNYFSQISDMFHDPIGFIDFLNNDTGFFDLPASTIGNCNYKGGLLEHSLNRTKILSNVNYFIANKKYSIQQCILKGLFYNINDSYIEGHFPYIWMEEENCGRWIVNSDIFNLNVEVKQSEKYKLLFDFIDKQKIEYDFSMEILLRFSNSWAKINEPVIIYNTLEDIELKLPEGYL